MKKKKILGIILFIAFIALGYLAYSNIFKKDNSNASNHSTIDIVEKPILIMDRKITTGINQTNDNEFLTLLLVEINGALFKVEALANNKYEFYYMNKHVYSLELNPIGVSAIERIYIFKEALVVFYRHSTGMHLDILTTKVLAFNINNSQEMLNLYSIDPKYPKMFIDDNGGPNYEIPISEENCITFIGVTEGFYDAPQEEVVSATYKLVFVNDKLQIIPIIYYKYKDIKFVD